MLDGANTAERAPQVSASAGVALVCAVSNEADVRYPVEGFRYTQETDTWDSPIRIGSSVIGTPPEHTLASDANGNFVVAFTGQRNNEFGVYSRTVYMDGSVSSLAQISLPMDFAPHDVRMDINPIGQGHIAWIQADLSTGLYQERYTGTPLRLGSGNMTTIDPPVVISAYEDAVPHANLAATQTGNMLFNYAPEGRQVLYANPFLPGKAVRRGLQVPVQTHSTSNIEIRNPVIALYRNTGAHIWEEGEADDRVIIAQSLFVAD